MKQLIKADVMIELLEVLSYIDISDRGNLWEEYETRIDALIENRTTYNLQIDRILEKYESSVEINSYDIELISGQSFKAYQYLEAKRVCAQAYLSQLYYSTGQELIIRIYLEMESFIREANRVFAPPRSYTIDNIIISYDCEYGWAPHNYESKDGSTHYWIEDQLDGSCGMSRVFEGIWFNISHQDR